MKRNRVHLAHALIFFSSLLAVDCEESKQRSISDLYNFRFDQCIERLDELLEACPNDPLVPFLHISARWQKELFHGSAESSYQVIYDGIKKTAPYYQDMIDRHPEDQRFNLFLGSLYGLKARVDLANSDWMALVISGAKGFSYINEAKDNDPDLHDVDMPIGTLEYFLCKSSSPLQVLGSVFGLGSDCEEAIRKLENASQNGELSWIEARNVLSHAYLYLERDLQRAVGVTSSLATNFPGHPFFMYLHAETLVKLERYTEYQSIQPRLKRFISGGPVNQRQECRDKFNYIEALRHFQLGSYEKAIISASDVIDGYDNEFKWILGYAHFIRGKSLDIIGKREQAVSDYKNAEGYLERYPEQLEALSLIERPFSAE